MSNLSKAIKEVLVKMAVNDKIPTDMNALDDSVFEQAIARNRQYGGISIEDVEQAAAQRGRELNEAEKMDVLTEFEDKIIFDGSGMHGAELIDYVMDELGL